MDIFEKNIELEDESEDKENRPFKRSRKSRSNAVKTKSHPTLVWIDKYIFQILTTIISFQSVFRLFLL